MWQYLWTWTCIILQKKHVLVKFVWRRKADHPMASPLLAAYLRIYYWVRDNLCTIFRTTIVLVKCMGRLVFHEAPNIKCFHVRFVQCKIFMTHICHTNHINVCQNQIHLCSTGVTWLDPVFWLVNLNGSVLWLAGFDGWAVCDWSGRH